MNSRRRGGSFHHDEQDDGSSNVQFVTPHYEGQGGPEPLDLSKLRLDNMGPDDSDSSDEEEDEEELYTRGRSRSRSVHANDSGSDSFMVNEGEDYSGSAPETPQSEMVDDGRGKAERTGPLQQREVVALQKGLEEATISLNPYSTREDEEERMAADAEKRKRLLAASQTNSGGGIVNSDPVRRVKLLLLGDSGVGKSSLIVRWTHDTFSPSLVSTVGVNFKNKKVTHQGELLQVQVWDTAGQEQFHKITTSYYKGAQGIMLVYDVADASSLANVEYWIKNIKAHAADSVQVVLVGNKIDLRNTDPERKCTDTQRGKDISLKFGVPFFEASAKDSSNVDDAFMTLVGHIADATSPAKQNPARATSLQGGLERKTSAQDNKLVDGAAPPAAVPAAKPAVTAAPKVGMPKPSGSEPTGKISPDHKEKCTVC